MHVVLQFSKYYYHSKFQVNISNGYCKESGRTYKRSNFYSILSDFIVTKLLKNSVKSLSLHTEIMSKIQNNTFLHCTNILEASWNDCLTKPCGSGHENSLKFPHLSLKTVFNGKTEICEFPEQ
jgi:hypothetical protein